MARHDAKRAGLAVAELVDLVFGDDEGQALLSLRLQEWLRQRPAQLRWAQERIRDMVRAEGEAVARETLSELSDWQTTLRAMANQLEDLEVRSRREVASDLDGGPVSGRHWP